MYIVIEVDLQHVREKKKLWDTLIETVQEMHGDFGHAAVERGFRVKYTDEKTNIAIISTSRNTYPLVASSLPFVEKVGQSNVKIKTLNVSGSLKHCLLFVKKHHKKCLWESKEGKKAKPK
ncbi:ribonuclease P/MRP protein subunit POP5 isoform X2 [Macrobrachium rosenbergii]|uniref:ribonuclease P/MRP protein subunit POP5 isoform X2 n=1 Tax=Macrobrachium rosenbergii TaxID=79674 RepID=UPI0034D44D50